MARAKPDGPDERRSRPPVDPVDIDQLEVGDAVQLASAAVCGTVSGFKRLDGAPGSKATPRISVTIVIWGHRGGFIEMELSAGELRYAPGSDPAASRSARAASAIVAFRASAARMHAACQKFVTPSPDLQRLMHSDRLPASFARAHQFPAVFSTKAGRPAQSRQGNADAAHR